MVSRKKGKNNSFCNFRNSFANGATIGTLREVEWFPVCRMFDLFFISSGSQCWGKLGLSLFPSGRMAEENDPL